MFEVLVPVYSAENFCHCHCYSVTYHIMIKCNQPQELSPITRGQCICFQLHTDQIYQARFNMKNACICFLFSGSIWFFWIRESLGGEKRGCSYYGLNYCETQNETVMSSSNFVKTENKTRALLFVCFGCVYTWRVISFLLLSFHDGVFYPV